MPSTRQRRQDRPRSLPPTDPYRRPNTRSRPGLRETLEAERPHQISFSNKRPRTEGRSAGISKSHSSKRHTSPQHPPRQIRTPQRNSLRCAIRESRRLSGETSLATPSLSPGPVPAGLQSSWLKSSTRPAPSNIPESSATANASLPVLKLLPQRNSLRRALRESLESVPPDYVQPSLSKRPRKRPSKRYSKLGTTQSNTPTVEPVSKITIETPNQGKYMRQAHHPTCTPSSTQEQDVSTATTPQRSSLRRALRQSLNATVQSNQPTGVALRVVDTGQDSVMKHTAEEPLPSSVRRKWSDELPSTPPKPYFNIPYPDTKEWESTGSPCVDSRTPSVSPITPPPIPLPSAAPKLSIALRSREKMTSEPGLSIQPTTIPSTTYSESLRHTVSSPKSRDVPSSLATVTTPKSPISTSSDQSMVDNGKPQTGATETQFFSTRKGWHQIREIINEVPSGLYLVEWEGRDPRTGVKWPSSWIPAKNVSSSAIHAWEEKKKHMLLNTTHSK